MRCQAVEPDATISPPGDEPPSKGAGVSAAAIPASAAMTRPASDARHGVAGARPGTSSSTSATQSPSS